MPEHRRQSYRPGVSISSSPAPQAVPADAPAGASATGLLPQVLARARFVFRTARLARVLVCWTIVQWTVSFGALGFLTLIGTSRWWLGPLAYDASLIYVACAVLLLAPSLAAQCERAAVDGVAGPGESEHHGTDACGPTSCHRVAVLARLVVVLPFVAVEAVPLAVLGLGLEGASPWAVPAHLLLLALMGWTSYCLGWAARAVGSRTAVGIVYVLTAAVAIGAPAAVLGLETVVNVQQEQAVYSFDGESNTQCSRTPTVRTRTVGRSELYWWLLVADPFAALADAAARGPAFDGEGDEPAWLVRSLNAHMGLSVDGLRDAHPQRVEIHMCSDDIIWDHTGTTIIVQADHVPFWPVSALLMVALAAASGTVGSRAEATRRRGGGPRRPGRG